MATPGIPPSLFRFLAELEKNNDRAWFEANKDRYLRDVRDPLLAFVVALEPRLAKVSPYLFADPRPVGGSLMRPYRDVRFSKDKRPYKTWAALRIHHHEGRDEPNAPSCYLHLERGRSFLGAGLWRPDASGLGRIRDAIVDDPAAWKKVCGNLDDGERLKRAPRGYDPEHALVEDLKRKGFTTSVQYTQQQICAPDFLTRFASGCRKASPLNAFLARAVGVPW